MSRSNADDVTHFLANYAPPVLDPFAGGGSIPLEAQRLGLRAHASDLNPVAVLINKALIETPPKFAGKPPVHPDAETRTSWSGAQGLAEDVRRYGKWMRDEAEKRIGHLYPKVKITQAMVDAGRPDLEPYLGQELTGHTPQERTAGSVGLQAESAKDVLTEILQEGDHKMLATAIKAEVDAYIDEHADERDANRKGRRQIGSA